jgi:hypothetical protein
LLEVPTATRKNWEQLAELISEHCLHLVTQAAHGCAEDWQQFGTRLRQWADRGVRGGRSRRR